MLPLISLRMEDVSTLLDRRLSLTVPTEGTGKRKVDGSRAATRLGSTVTEAWCNERFRQERAVSLLLPFCGSVGRG
eukprot:854526-Prymnesium_polylepis.2